MPLAFSSLSHGTVAFGFFNIETDMLLLDRIVFHAADFCAAAALLGEGGESTIEGWRIDDMGDLHAAIAGEDLSGFIGATYARYPFPADPAGFRQSPEPRLARGEVQAMADRFGRPCAVVLRRGDDGRTVHVDGYTFDERGFCALVRYVAVGGYPRWRDDGPPGYVTRMEERLGPCR
jgi:hypothetical protein